MTDTKTAAKTNSVPLDEKQVFNLNKGSYDHRQYKAFQPIVLKDRTWPDQQINKAPSWCSVDLRDGNQALVQPMNVEQKLVMFKLLVKLGFKEIEIGFPSAAQTEFDFARKLIEDGLIPDDVTVQVLTQAREHLIKRSFESLAGAKRACVHVYNSTSVVQREQVFAASKAEISAIAIQGASWVKAYADTYPQTDWVFQYSPESFTGTEIDYAAEVCNQVIAVWQPELGREVIINLPSTVEMATPNVFADQIESMCRKLDHRDKLTVSLHTHNDRGCGVAASELGLMAGADRIEGTLLGNGERTGNMDIVTMAMNIYSQGIDPELDLSDMAEIISVVEYCTNITVHPRHPWAGELVYTAFSGSHQDAIRKSIHHHHENQLTQWDVAYLPINPADLGRRYEEVVRINSQSGRGGVGLVLERDHGYRLPKWILAEIGPLVQKQAEQTGQEVNGSAIKELFDKAFVEIPQGWTLGDYAVRSGSGSGSGSATSQRAVSFSILKNDQAIELVGVGSGVLEALMNALNKYLGLNMHVKEYDEHALSHGTGSQALASVAIAISEGASESFACAIHEDSARANLQACLSAVGRLINENQFSVAGEIEAV